MNYYNYTIKLKKIGGFLNRSANLLTRRLNLRIAADTFIYAPRAYSMVSAVTEKMEVVVTMTNIMNSHRQPTPPSPPELTSRMI